MAYKVTNVKEIDYIHMTDEERSKIWRLNELYFEWSCTTFDTENDYYALYVDLNFHDGDDDADRQYAVYLKESGKLLCLLVDAVTALEGYSDSDYGMKRNELYKQIAMVAGWPEKLPAKRYTVRLHRILDVEIRAENDEQADKIGLLLANHNVLNYINSELSLAWKANSTGEYDELGYVVPAIPESEGVWDLSLDEVDCKRILKEGI